MSDALALLIIALPTAEEPAAPGNGAPPGGSPFNMFFIILIVMMIFLVVAPLLNKRERRRQARLKELKKHDRVVTTGGIIGTITAIDEGTATLEIAKDVRIKVRRANLYDLENPPEEPPKGARPVEKKAG